jgi:autotransporter-associated beta strand protein
LIQCRHFESHQRRSLRAYLFSKSIKNTPFFFANKRGPLQMKKISALLAILSLVFSPVTPAFAVDPETYVWTGLGADTNVLTAGNWDQGHFPGAITDNIIFASGGVTATVDSDNFEMASITFDRAVDFSITSGAGDSFLKINAGGITAENNVDGDRTYTVSQDVTLGASQTWTVSNGGLDTTLLVVSGAIGDGGNGYGLTKADDGVLTLSGANTFTGATEVDGGTLNLDYSTENNSKLSDTDALVLGGGTLNLIGGSYTEVVASTEFAPGASSVTRSSGTSVLQMNALSSNIGSTVNFGAAGIATTDKTNTNGILGGWATVGGTDWAINSTDAADGAITAYVGYTSDFWLGAGDNTTVTNNGTVVGCTTNSLRFNAAGAYTLTLDSTNTITSGGILVTSNVGNNLNTITGGTLQGASGEDLVVIQNNTLGALTIGSIIQDNTSATGLTKSGVGELILTGVNLYTGTTYVNEGTLTITNSSALGDTDGVEVADGGVLKLDGSEGDIVIGDVALSLYGPSGYELGALYSAGGDNSWAGDITLTGNAGVEAAGGSTLLLTGNITGDYNFGKFGEGEVTLTGNNTYAGVTKLASGTLNINSNTALGTGIFMINSGTTIDNTSGGLVTLENNNDQHWESAFTFTGTNDLDLGMGDVDISDAAMTITVEDSNLTVGGNISDGGVNRGFTKAGAGTLILSGANTYTGDTTISEGTLQIGDGGTTGSLSTSSAIINNGTLSFQRTNTVTQGTDFASVISGTGGVTQEDSGTLILNGANTYTGATTVSRAGTLELDFSAEDAPTDDIINSSSALVLGGGSLLLTGSGSHDTIQSFAGTTLNSGASTITLENDSDEYFLDLDLGEISTNAGSTVNFSGLVAGGDYGNYAWTTTELDDSGILGAWATVNGTDYATVAFDDWLPGNYVLAYDDYTDIDAYGGEILDGANTNVRINTTAGEVGAPITLGETTDPSGWFTIHTLLQNTTVAVTVDTASGGGSLDVSGIMIGVGMGSLTLGVEIDDSSLYAATQNGEIVLINNSTLGDLTINASIGEWEDPAGSSSLVKSGVGEVILNGTNLYTGTTYVNEGTLTITNNSALGTTAGGVVVADGGILKLDGSGGNINVGAEALSLNGPSGYANGALYSVGGDNSWAGNITLTGSAGVEVGSDSTLELSGDITGDYILSKYGEGELTLSGDNDHSGGTQLFGGTLNINSNTALGTGILVIYSGTTLNSTNGITLTNNNDQAWESDFTFTGTNDLNLGTGDVDMSNADVTITVEDSNLTVGGVISDDEDGVSQGRSLTKTGSGTLTLSGANTYTGATTVNEGALNIQNDTALGTTDAGTSVASGAALEIQGDGLGIVEALTLNGTGTGAATGALRNISGHNTWGGTIALGSATRINSDADQLDLFGDITGAGQSLTIGGASHTLIYGIISTGDLIKDGGGILLLDPAEFNDAPNTYTGSTTINGGKLLIYDGEALPQTTAVIIADGAQLHIDTKYGPVDVTLGSLSGSGTVRFTTDGTLTVGDAASTTFGGVIYSSSSYTAGFTKIGAGALTLTGANTYTGTTTIGAGTLVAGNASALGSGDVSNDSILDVGLTDLDIGGTYTQDQAGTNLKLTANSTDDFGSVNVTGDAVLSAGTIDITVAGYLANGATLDILTSDGTLTYAGTTLTAYAHYTFTGVVSGQTLTVTANRAENGFASDAGGNSNSAAVGAVLDNIQGASGDMLDVLDTLDGMSAGAVGNALGTMTPDVSSGSAEGSRALTSQGFSTVSNRLGGARNGGASGSGVSSGDMLNGVGVWMQALGSHIKQETRKGIEGYMANLFGTTVGADKVLDDHFRAGLAGSFGFARVKSKTAGSPSDDINSYQATLYGSYDSLDLCKARQGGKKSYEAVRSQVEDSWYVDGMAAFTQNNYDSRREIWVTPTSGRIAKAEHYGQQYSTNFETGYKFVFEKTKALEVTPFVSLGYNYLYMNKYKEKGADSLNLTVDGEGFHQLEQGLGTKLAYPMVAKKVGTFIPSAKAAWLYDYIGDRFETTSSFAGGGTSFTTQGAKPAKSGMLFGAELAFLNKGNVTLTGNWDIELKDQFMSNTYYGTVRYDF